MAFETGTASDYIDLWHRMQHFICGNPTQSPVTGVRAGDGTLASDLGSMFRTGHYGTPEAITETWTLTCTAAATHGGTFSVVGSISGAQPDATVGTPYDNGKLKFTINDGTADFIVGDQFIFTLTQGKMKQDNQHWVRLGTTADGHQAYRGLGLTRNENIYMYTGTFADTGADVYNFWVSSALGYYAANNWKNQPGALASANYVYGWNAPIPYWLVANGQRIILVFKVSTTYHALHVGKILPYALPSEYGYPVYCGGEHTSHNMRWSSVSEDMRHFVDPGLGNYICLPDGNWHSVRNWKDQSGAEVHAEDHRNVWPFAGGSQGSYSHDRQRAFRENVDGTYSLLPLIISSSSPSTQILGEIDGAYWVSGFNNAAENIITIGGVDYLVVQNVFRTHRFHYWALKLA